jgi:ketosteroid isomerase-like protein
MPRVIALVLAAAAVAIGSPDDEIRRVLSLQTEAWNRGDIPAFMEYYAPDTLFVGREKVTRGSAALKARYLRDYPTRGHMGVLAFSDLDIHPLGPKSAYAVGRWHLDRGAEGGGAVGGLFSLVFEKRQDRWLIVLDHTH